MANSVLYVPGETFILAEIEGGKSTYGEPVEELKRRYPGAVLMDWAEAEPQITAATHAKYDKPPCRIMQERYEAMYDILPPINAHFGGETESFMVSERLYDNVVMIFAKIGDRYYEMTGEATLSHQKILESIRDSLGDQ